MSSFDVLDAIETVLQTLAAGNPDFPACERNQPLERAFETLNSGAMAYGNMVDGDADPLSEALGATGNRYERRANALLELVVKADSEPARRAALVIILTALEDAFEVDRTLGGVAGYCEIISLQRLGQAIEADPELTGVTVEIAADYVSDRPF
jgi:hypothetical protein